MSEFGQASASIAEDIETRLRGASELLGGVANLIELGTDLGDLTEESAQRLGTIILRVVGQVDFVQSQLIPDAEEEPIPHETVEDLVIPEAPVEIQNNNAVPAYNELARSEVEEFETFDEEENILDVEKESTIADPEMLYEENQTSDLDWTDTLNEDEQKILAKLTDNPGINFRGRELSELFDAATQATRNVRLKNFLNKVKISPLANNIRAQGQTRARVYVYVPSEESLSGVYQESVKPKVPHPDIITIEPKPILLTEWGMELKSGNEIWFEGKKIPLRDATCEVVKILITNGEPIRYEDLLEKLQEYDEEIDGNKLLGILHELTNAFEGYMNPEWLHDKALRTEDGITRFITIKGRLKEVDSDFLALTQVKSSI